MIPQTLVNMNLFVDGKGLPGRLFRSHCPKLSARLMKIMRVAWVALSKSALEWR